MLFAFSKVIKVQGSKIIAFYSNMKNIQHELEEKVYLIHHSRKRFRFDSDPCN